MPLKCSQACPVQRHLERSAEAAIDFLQQRKEEEQEWVRVQDSDLQKARKLYALFAAGRIAEVQGVFRGGAKEQMNLITYVGISKALADQHCHYFSRSTCKHTEAYTKHTKVRESIQKHTKGHECIQKHIKATKKTHKSNYMQQ